MDPKCLLTSTDLQTRRARCQHQLSFLFDDLCKRSARFILECIQSDSSLVRSIARFGIVTQLLLEMSCFCVLILAGISMSLFKGELISLMRGFCHTSMIRLPIVIGVQLSHYWIS